MAIITFDDKVDVRNSNVPDINKITAADINEIKTVVNENEQLKKYSITLNKTQLNNFDSQDVIIPAEEFDLPNDAILLIQRTKATKDRDGVDFTMPGFRGISLNNYTAIGQAQIVESSDKEYFTINLGGGLSAINELPFSNDVIVNTGSTAISGGGANATIKIDIYYKAIFFI